MKNYSLRLLSLWAFALGARGWAPASPQLLTQWAKTVSPSNARPEHPRPDAWRPSWQSLNGLWEADASPKDLNSPPFAPRPLPSEILVPFPFESSLGGLRVLPTYHYMWYRLQNVTVNPQAVYDGGRVLLKFEAVDWFAVVYVNGIMVGNHSGGYDGFHFDITDQVHAANTFTQGVRAANRSTQGVSLEIVVGVFDPTEEGDQPHGKQSMHVFAATKASSKYTSTSGIWATVWLEHVPSTYIADHHFVTTLGKNSAEVVMNVTLGGEQRTDCEVTLDLSDHDTHPSPPATAPSTTPVTMTITPMPKLWSPAGPFLYNATITLTCAGAKLDQLESYIGIRTIALKRLKSPPTPGCAYPPGHELPGYPKPAASAVECEAACLAPACSSWTFGPAPSPPGPSGPEPGIDQHGGDLPNMPLNITRPGMTVNESARECESLCRNNSACHKWAIDVPGCASSHHQEYSDFECWLKSDRTRRIQNHCRISGTVRTNNVSVSSGMCTLQSLIPSGIMTLGTNGSCGYWATKLMLNNEPAPFLAGILSQGFWPDGEYAVPDDKADIFELESEKAMGFNFIRKHIKVGPHRWYYHADRLGFFVFQDMPETIHGTGRGATFTQELRAMVLGRRNHPSIVMWDIFNEASPSLDLVQRSAQLIRALDPTRPVNANSGFKQQPWWGVSDVQDFHSDAAFYGDINASLMVSVSEAHRCGCLPPKQHMWFHALPEDRACYSVEKGVDCDAASATYMPWAQADASAVRFLGLGATGYVQNRDMEGECNGLLTYDAVQKLNSTPIVQGNRLLSELHDSIWRPTRV